MSRPIPFHEAGVEFTATDGPVTPADAVVLAELDFTVAVVSAYDDWDGGFRKSEEYFFTRREDTGDLLGSVKRTYAPIQNLDGFSFLSVVTDSGEAIIDSGGAARNGAISWLYCRVPENVYLLGDVDEQFTLGFLTTNGHDGKRALKVRPILQRLATDTLLTGRGFGKPFSLRHAGTQEGKVQEARQALGITFKSLQDFMKVAERLNSVWHTRDTVDSLLIRLFPAQDESLVPPQTQQRRDGVKAVLYGSPALANYRDSKGDVTGLGYYFAVAE